MDEHLTAAAEDEFRRRFGGEPEAVGFAPGRVNLIGEHVDYLGGVVLPAPLARGTGVALRLRTDGVARAASRHFAAPFSGRIDDEPRHAGFAAYPLAAVAALRERGIRVAGFDLAIASELPIGAGLSSSASLLVATLRAFDARERLGLAPVAIAELAFRAETGFVGVACGRMDPFACAVARPGHALRLDCRDGSFSHVSLPLASLAFVVVDSGIRRELAHSAYNRRVVECAVALEALRRVRPDIGSWRDATRDDVAALGERVAPEVAARAAHVVAEIARVDAFRSALEGGDLAAVGALLDEGHRDLSERFEVSLPALDALARRLRASPGCLGARLTGAGFGGCLVAAVRREAAAAFAEEHGGFVAL